MIRAIVPLLMLPALAAAEPFATASSADGSTVTLHTDAGPCVNGALHAIWSSPDAKSTVPGCWVIRGGTVVVSWLDGDRGQIPADRLKRATGG